MRKTALHSRGRFFNSIFGGYVLTSSTSQLFKSSIDTEFVGVDLGIAIVNGNVRLCGVRA